VAVHVVWRRLHYGAWLPNTFYAKTTSAWPESGLRYLAAFALEYALWLALPFVIAGLAAAWRRGARPRPGGVVAVGCLLAHAAFYTLVIGGDHFEFRVYSQLVPLIGLALLGSLAALRLRRPLALAIFAVFLATGWLIPWTHWWKTRSLERRSETHLLYVPVAASLPPPFRWLGAGWDELERWLIGHHVGLRHQEHKVFQEHLRQVLPSRERGAHAFDGIENPVIAAVSVGVVGWVYPRAHVIDLLGLNDAVIARSPSAHLGRRAMAHERRPPPGYVEAFQPLLEIDGRLRMFRPERTRPLGDAEIRAAEARYRAALEAPP
jgi:arabinofuranosyltransferase